MPNIDNILKQLKSRKVFRSLAIYAGFAFVLIQVCDIVIPRLFLPEWTITFIIVLTIIGFPIIAVLSWIYDITPTEGEEAPSTEATQPLGVYALTGLVLTVIGVGFWVAVGVFGVSFGGDDEVPSIAIIPFENKGAEEDEFYAYSISSELISDVTSAGLIRVASLKRVEELGDINIEEKAQKLDVRYITTGSIWKIDSIFQLSMELYDTKTSKVLWSESWQKGWNELASIKGNLADNILKSLKVSTKQDIAKTTTSNSEAYEYYLKGKYKYEKRENMEDTEIARGLLRKAIELDDNLLLAKNVLANTYYVTGDYDKSMEIYLENLKKAEEIGDKDIQGRSLNNIGNLHYSKGDYDTALDYYERSLAISEEIGDKSGMGISLNNIGNVHSDKGDYDTALDYYERSLAIAEEIGNKNGMGISLGNIGTVHHDKGDLDTALDYYERSLAIREELGDKNRMGDSLNNIGNVHADKGDYDTALDYYEKSLAIKEEIGDKNGMGISLGNIGNVHSDKGDLDTALDYFKRSLAIREELGDKRGLGGSLLSIGNVHADKGDYDTALDYFKRSLAIDEELGDKYGMGYSLNNIGMVHTNKGDYKKAFSYLQKAVNLQKEIGALLLETVTLFALAKTSLGKEYDEKEILKLIKKKEHKEDYLNYFLYQLLEDPSYLETAYNQIQEKADNLEPDVKLKFLELTIPKAIVEEWEKVK